MTLEQKSTLRKTIKHITGAIIHLRAYNFKGTEDQLRRANAILQELAYEVKISEYYIEGEDEDKEDI